MVGYSTIYDLKEKRAKKSENLLVIIAMKTLEGVYKSNRQQIGCLPIDDGLSNVLHCIDTGS